MWSTLGKPAPLACPLSYDRTSSHIRRIQSKSSKDAKE